MAPLRQAALVAGAGLVVAEEAGVGSEEIRIAQGVRAGDPQVGFVAGEGEGVGLGMGVGMGRMGNGGWAGNRWWARGAATPGCAGRGRAAGGT